MFLSSKRTSPTLFCLEFRLDLSHISDVMIQLFDGILLSGRFHRRNSSMIYLGIQDFPERKPEDSGRAADREAAYRRNLVLQILGQSHFYEDHEDGSEESFRRIHENWLAPQCAVLEWLLGWIETRYSVTARDLEPFLELGAFSSHLSGYLATRRGMKGTVSDLDLEIVKRSIKEILPRLGLHARRLDLVSINAESIDAPDRFFGLVFIFSGLHHFENPGKCLREIHRVLKPGGFFLCAYEPLQPLFRRSRKKVAGNSSEVREGLIENVFTLAQYDRMIREVFPRAVSCPYDHLRMPIRILQRILYPIRTHSSFRHLRRLIIKLFGGQDYSVVARKS